MSAPANLSSVLTASELDAALDVSTWRALYPHVQHHPLTAAEWVARPLGPDLQIGDTVEHGSYNLTYTGPIVAIGPQTVTVRTETGHGNMQMHLADFDRRNWDLDLDAIHKRNSEWYD